MTDRIAGIVVALEHDVRDDDADAVLAAIRQIRGVLSVEVVESEFAIHIAEQRARIKLTDQILQALRAP